MPLEVKKGFFKDKKEEGRRERNGPSQGPRKCEAYAFFGALYIFS